MISMKEKTNWRHMASVRSTLREGTREAAREVAEALVNDITANWGMDGAPSIDTGNLNSAVMVNEKGRDAAGRFANSENVVTYIVTANAPDGDSYHGRGNYSRALEEGWSNDYSSGGPFPFMQPAIERVMPLYAAIIKRRWTNG